MNKKFKIIIAATLIFQLLIPAGFLYHHYTAINFALEHSLEYKFKLLDMRFSDYRASEGDPTDIRESLRFDVGGTSRLYNKKIAVTVGEDGFADLSELEDKDYNCWFDYDYCEKNSRFKADKFSFEPDVDVKALKKEIREAYAWASNLHENGCFAYVTAKVYKGVFIPTAIYVKGEKVITIHAEN